jgi:hypothetical protein
LVASGFEEKLSKVLAGLSEAMRCRTLPTMAVEDVVPFMASFADSISNDLYDEALLDKRGEDDRVVDASPV